MCGEKRVVIAEFDRLAGSPPRVRGKAGVVPAQTYDHRITPACAGKSMDALAPYCDIRDHPRVCGEKFPADPALSTFLGSPPRVRGKGGFASQHNSIAGITPACAGKSSIRYLLSGEYGDHPRVCGEKGMILMAIFGPLGSPPRVRGKDGFPGIRQDGNGITPACAGKSRSML